MLTPDECRKNVCCWSCIHSSISDDGNSVEVSCASDDSQVRSEFHGWETAKTCKGYRMKPYIIATHSDT